jgi:phosphomannomutase/phosphoglucomutase
MLIKLAAGEKVAPEAYKLNGIWHISFASPVPNGSDNKPIGTLLTSIGSRALHDLLSHLEYQQGETLLHLSLPDSKPQLIAKAGKPVQAPGLSSSSLLANPSWKVQYFPSAEWLAEQRYEEGMFWISAGGAGALILCMLVFLQFKINRGLKQDAATIVEQISALADGKNKAGAALQFSQLTGIPASLDRLDLSAGQESSQEPASPSVETGEESQNQPEPHNDQETDALDIELIVEQEDDEADEEVDLTVPAEIFRDYDIRGLATTLNDDLVYHIGLAIGTEAHEQNQNRIMLGADGRHSSPQIRSALVRGLLDSGLEIIDIGLSPTPLLYFSTQLLETHTGVMVTGSHNPPDYNGIKIFINGASLCGDQIQAIKKRIEEKNFHRGKGSERQANLADEYINKIVDDVAIAESLKLVVDCGNGVAGLIAPRLLETAGCEVIPLHCELDGDFPNHHPDPSVPENLQDLVEKVKQENADLGIAFDGDGDRIGVVSQSGEIIPADKLLMIFARDVIAQNPGADVIFDIKCSYFLNEIINESGGRPIMCKSGHSWIKEKMRETGALLGGEFTGHICFSDRWYGFDDALYAAARLLEIITVSQQTVEELISEFPASVASPEIHIPVADDEKFELLEKLKKQADFADARLIDIDGIRAEFKNGWGLVRASNTIPAIMLRFEADDEAAMEHIKGVFKEQLNLAAPTLDLTF